MLLPRKEIDMSIARSLLFLLVAAASPLEAQAPPAAPPYLYVWSGTADTVQHAAFMVAFDLRPGSPTSGKIVKVVYAGPGISPHHTEHQLETDGLLFANDFGGGTTYRFDLSTPGDPKLLGSFTTAGPYAYPHSFVRLANGDRLATYQKKIDGSEPGGLVELKPDGTALRWASAAPADGDSTQLVPYSLDVLAPMDRVVSTSTSMTDLIGVNVQVWRLSDLKLLQTMPVPIATEHGDHNGHGAEHHMLPGEPRTLADGKTVMFGTFTCGLYRVTDVAKTAKVEFVHSFPGKWCAVPVVVGKYWVWTVPELRAVVSLDVSNPAKPKEVSRLVLGGDIEPHWMAKDESGTRLVVNTGGHAGDARMYMLRIDPKTGALSKDSTLPVLEMGTVEVPGIGDVVAKPHGAVFAR
jgi:hypothetical protein